MIEEQTQVNLRVPRELLASFDARVSEAGVSRNEALVAAVRAVADGAMTLTVAASRVRAVPTELTEK